MGGEIAQLGAILVTLSTALSCTACPFAISATKEGISLTVRLFIESRRSWLESVRARRCGGMRGSGGRMAGHGHSGCGGEMRGMFVEESAG